MSRNEIRLRRRRMTASGADRFRNYSDVLNRHERDVRARKLVRAFIMFMIVIMLIGLIFFLSQIEKGDVPFEDAEPSTPTHSAMYAPGSPSMP